MSLDTVRRYVSSAPDAPDGIEAWKWVKAPEGCRTAWVANWRALIVPTFRHALSDDTRIPPSTLPVEPMIMVVDECGVWWDVGWSAEAETTVYWCLGYLVDRLALAQQTPTVYYKVRGVEGL